MTTPDHRRRWPLAVLAPTLALALAVGMTLVCSGAASAAGVRLSPTAERQLAIATQTVTLTHRATEVDAFAKVLDPEPLVQLDSDLATAQAAAEASGAEAARAKALHAADGGVSAKDTESAVAQARSDALKVEILLRRVGLEWGPGVVRMTPAARGRLVRGLAAGKIALVHVDTHNNEGQAGARVVKVDIGDGSATGVVLGPARAAEPRLQSSGLLVEVTGPTAILLSVGLTQSAHIETSTAQAGVLVPRAAVIRFKGSDWVYVRAGPGVYVRRLIEGPVPQKEGFFVPKGLSPGDEVVARGAAALFTAEQSLPQQLGVLTMLSAVVRWSLERPRLIAWACLWFLVCGALWVRDIRFDLLPELAPAETSIQTEAPGLAAEQVENLVTRPIETPLIGASGVAAVHSESVEGLSVVTIRFAPGADPSRVREVISERLQSLAGALPDGAAPGLAPLTPRRALVLEIGFTSAKLDPMALRDVVQWTVRPRLLAAPGVARVAVYGGQVRRIEVRARPADLSDSDLGFLDILYAARRATSVAGAGFIDTDAQRILIEPHGQALTKEDVGAGQIQVSGAAPVRIDDVADVVEAPAPASGDALIDGKPGVLVEVARQYGANALQTTGAVQTALAALTPALTAQGVSVRTDLNRPAAFATDALRGVAADLAIGAALVAIALLVLLRDPLATLISLVSIPLSLLAAVMVLKALGMTLNAMTLGGLAVGLAVVIDDAVIDVENILADLRDAAAGRASRLEAVLAASLEVRGPVIYATLAMIVAMAPILLLKGPQGALFIPLAAAVIAAALASLVVAAVVTPALCLLFLRHVGPARDPPLLVRLEETHERWLSGICPRRRIVMAVSAALALVAIAALFTFRPAFTPSVPDDHLVAQASGPPSSSLAVSRDFGQRIAAAVAPLRGVRSISQRIGRDPTGDDSWGPERSVFDIALAPGLGAAEQRRIAGAVLDRLRDFPGLAPTVSSRFDSLRLGAAAGAPFQVSVFGQDLDAVDVAAARIASVIGALPGAGDVRVDNPPRAPVVRVDVNFQRLALFGLSSADILATVQAAFEGERVAQIYEGGRVVDLAVSAQESLRRDPEGVGALLLRSASGISVPLKAVANVYLTDDRAVIAHDGGLRREVVTASPRDQGDFARRARRAIADKVSLPPGAFLEFGAPGGAEEVSASGLPVDYVLALFVIFGALAIAFDGRTGALILASTLFSLIGAVAAVALMGGVLSLGAVVGFIALFGLSMRGAILLFAELEQRLLARHAPWSLETVASTARDRLPPVILSALLVALALAPLAVHAGAPGREILGPMAIVIMGGLVTSTLGVLFALPAIILALWRPAWARRARRHGPPAPAA